MDIVNNKTLLDYINYVKSLQYDDQRLIFLTSNHPEWITNQILFDYYTPEVILADGDLLKLIESHRLGDIPRSGLLTMDPVEINYLMKAWRSQQYHRFMSHITFRYLNPANGGAYPLRDEGEHECCVCWRSLHGTSDKVDNDTAWVAKGTKTCICKSCLTQLAYFAQLMVALEDKDFVKLIS